jgi:hypothetical protein
MATSRSVTRATSAAGGRCVAADGGDLDGRGGLDRLGARDGEGPGLIRAGDPAGALGAVEARALGGAERLVAELRVADGAAEDGEEQVLRDTVGEELVVREDR